MADEPEYLILTEGGRVRSVVEVVRRTKTQVVVRDGTRERRFRNDGGKEVGWGGSFPPFVRAGTSEQIATVREEQRRRRLIRHVEAIRPEKLTTAQLDAIVAVLRQPTA